MATFVVHTPDTPGSLLDRRYYVWSGLVALHSALTLFAGVRAVSYLLMLGGLLWALWGLRRPVEIFYLFVLGYSTNLTELFTRSELINAGGIRLLFPDLLLGILYLTFLLLILKKGGWYRFYLMGLFFALTAFWGFNFVRGLFSSSIGYVIGEGRFYLMSVLTLLIVYFFRHQPEEKLRRVLHIFCLASVNIAFFVLLKIVHTLMYGGGEGRFNPGNGLVQILVFAMLIALVDYVRGTNYHLFRTRKILLVGFYLAVIFLTGVRSMLVVTGVVVVFFVFLSSAVPLVRKASLVVGMIAMGLAAYQVPAVQRVLDTQLKYLEVLQGGGGKHSKTTVDFRQGMWKIFIEHVASDPRRALIGRPFDFELIDISELGWMAQHTKRGTSEEGKLEVRQYVDNSLAHNDFVAMSATNGFVFTGLLLALLLAYVVRGWLLSVWRTHPFSALALLWAWFLLTQIWQSGTNAEIKHYGWSVMLWVHMGMLAVIFNAARQFAITPSATEAPARAVPSSHPLAVS